MELLITMGNGHPLAAVVTTEEIATAFDNGMEYFNTYGGNPVSCAIGNEVLNVIEQENLQAHALEMGQYIKGQLGELKQDFNIIGDIRGQGLFLGVELVQDAVSVEPAPKLAHYIVERMKQRGILMSSDGPHHNVLKIKPPMCIRKEDVDFMVENLEVVLGEVKKGFLK